METSIFEGILWTQGFYRCINTTPPILLSHEKYAGTYTTPRKHYVSFASLPDVFLYQTRPFPTYLTHLHSTGSTRKAAPWSTVRCCFTFSGIFPCRQWQLLVMSLCFSSLTPSLLPVFSLPWGCWTEKPQDTVVLLVHRIKGVPSKPVKRPTPTVWLSLEVEHHHCPMHCSFLTWRIKMAACSVADSKGNKVSSPTPPPSQMQSWQLPSRGTSAVACSQSTVIFPLSIGGDNELLISAFLC